jgi:Ni,Fe-hydrogenase III large subunit
MNRRPIEHRRFLEPSRRVEPNQGRDLLWANLTEGDLSRWNVLGPGSIWNIQSASSAWRGIQSWMMEARLAS